MYYLLMKSHYVEIYMTIICLINFMQIWMVSALPLAKTLTSVHAITRVDAITCTGVISSVHVTCKDKFNNTAFHTCVRVRVCVCVMRSLHLFPYTSRINFKHLLSY